MGRRVTRGQSARGGRRGLRIALSRVWRKSPGCGGEGGYALGQAGGCFVSYHALSVYFVLFELKRERADLGHGVKGHGLPQREGRLPAVVLPHLLDTSVGDFGGLDGYGEPGNPNRMIHSARTHPAVPRGEEEAAPRKHLGAVRQHLFSGVWCGGGDGATNQYTFFLSIHPSIPTSPTSSSAFSIRRGSASVLVLVAMGMVCAKLARVFCGCTRMPARSGVEGWKWKGCVSDD